MSRFASELKKLSVANLTKTENGAVTHKSTGSACLDLFSRAGAMRKASEDAILKLVDNAVRENSLNALRILFYLRDVRGGQGERRVFRTALKHLAETNPQLLLHNIQHVPTFGRYDDLFTLMGTKLEGLATGLISDQIVSDSTSAKPSLLAKWMPSNNTSSKATRALANKLAKSLGWSPKVYRKTLSRLRSKLSVVEKTISSREWAAVNYSHVPSVASLKYRKAFTKHDGTRYSEYIASVMKGEKKINASVLTPYDLVNKVMHGQYDQTIEAQWKNLPDFFEGKTENSLVVADVSGSMSGNPMNVCLSLAIYIAERNKGHFHNTFMTFSSKPSIQEIVGSNLNEKCRNLVRAQWEMSTNLEAAFDLILSTAVDNKLYQEELPTTLYIISDMEFNACVRNSSMTNFQSAKTKFEEAGYKLPDVVFWNVNARNEQSPVTKDEKGTFLVSGCSPSILKHAINKTTCTPIDFMLEVINSPRYSVIS